MVLRVLLLIMVLIFSGCATTGSVKLPVGDTGFRAFLKENQVPYISLSETETVLSKGTSFYGSLNEYCKAIGGKLYLYKVKTFQSLEGTREHREEVAYENLSILDTKYFSSVPVMYPTCKTSDGKVLFEGGNSFYTGRGRFVECYATIFKHSAEPVSDFSENGDVVLQNKDLSLNEFLSKLLNRRLEVLPDGTYSFYSSMESPCSPITYPVYLTMLNTYCQLKGGEFFVDDGQSYKEFINPATKDKVQTRLMFLGRKFVCRGPETFTVKVREHSSQNEYVSLMYYVAPGDLTQSSSIEQKIQPEKTAGDSTGSSSGLDADLEELILATANNKTPRYLTKGALNYTTTYNYSEDSCHYVSLIKQIGDSSRKTTTNYTVCGTVITPLEEEKDYFNGAPRDVLLQANRILKPCRQYGSTTTKYNDFRIDCRVLNPTTPCFVEVTITRSGRLVEKKTQNACQ